MHLDAFNEFMKHSNQINESVQCPNLTDAKRRCFIFHTSVIDIQSVSHSASKQASQPASQPAQLLLVNIQLFARTKESIINCKRNMFMCSMHNGKIELPP